MTNLLATSILLLIIPCFVYSQTCMDSASACTSWAANGFCTNSFYSAATRQSRCAKTCGYCTVTATTTGSSTGCSDNYAACPSWKNNGFCTNPFYTEATRIQYCQKSCALCSATATTTVAASEDTTTDGG
ncbi:unnamed protein product [Caenorhabditis angaria]|uniref:ShKT domain-containing protein n=1 Tax=Caenorhabditis angaria TaxID=860376 RepID=A0A9P1J1R3_9PELO|nr:unnamed protein product [Caenorhabditis angaria]CAI5453435.1 unnamed protein product [Caenorhabditis angaria]